ncbi:MAG: ABC transporter permease [Actinomycetota bacterium]|nr:ABC transporter permease [Actinomycetota bacterium]
MSATATATRSAPAPASGSRLRWAFSDAVAVTKRNLIHYVRVPELLIFSTIQPVMFVLLFVFVFGGAIRIPGISYKDYLMPGILVQTAVFGAVQTGIGLADDLSRGMIDRFRSLPMARSAVLAGRTASDTVRNLFVILLMSGVGYLVGARFHGGLLGVLAGFALALLFGLAFSWISAFIGMTLKDTEAVQAASFIWIFPLTFASSAFVGVQQMPGWLQAWAKANPVSITVDALRDLMLGTDVTHHSLRFDLFWSAVWIAGILAVFVPLAVTRYRKAA